MNEKLKKILSEFPSREPCDVLSSRDCLFKYGGCGSVETRFYALCPKQIEAMQSAIEEEFILTPKYKRTIIN
jgi:hypothetical protein